MSALDSLQNDDFSILIKESTAKIMSAIETGDTFSDALAELPALTTSQAIGMVRAGEVGGIMEWTIRFLADWIELENSQREIELVFWCRTVGAMISGGTPIKQALDCSLDVARSKGLKQAVHDLADTIDASQPLESVLDKYTDVFPPAVRIAIIAGDKIGALGYTLQWVATEVHCQMSIQLFGKELHPKIPNGEWLDSFVKTILDYLNSDSTSMRATAATILGRLGAIDLASRILVLFSDECPQVRASAITAIVEFDYKKALPDLIKRLEDADPSVRRAAITAIDKMELHQAASEVALLIEDIDQRVANTAIKALESMKDIDILTKQAMQSLQAERSISRLRSVQVLLNHPTIEAADVLIKALDDEVFNVECYAALALSKLKRKEAIPTLIKMLEYPYVSYMQRCATEALREIGDTSAIPHIKRAIDEGRLDSRFMYVVDELEK
jgi:HEAT repeat protein